MTGLIDAAGTVGEGAVWARTAEPRAGEAHDGAHGTHCLNCGAALIGRYCHHCGQSSHVHRTLMSIGHDLLHGVFHFEGKIWRTLPMLVLRPGQLTRRYIAGERARFVSPLALFLFTVFLMFATFSALQSTDLGKGLADGLTRSTAQIDKARADTAQQIAAAERERAGLVTARRPTAAVDKRLASLRSDAKAMEQVGLRLGKRTDNVNVHSSWAWLDDGIERARENPGLVIYKVQSAAYKFSWALIILSTPLVALLFLWRRRFGLYDHATFVTYSISFMSLLVIAADVAWAAGASSGLIVPLALLAAPAHMFVQLRGAYDLGWFSALWRTAVLVFISVNALLFFVLGVVALEVAH